MQKRKLSQVGREAVERLNLPPEVAAGVPQLELYGNRQIYISGHRGVISYSTEDVAIAGGSLTVSPEAAPIDNGFILKYGGIEENCSLRALFSSMKDQLQDKVNAALW